MFYPHLVIVRGSLIHSEISAIASGACTQVTQGALGADAESVCRGDGNARGE